MRFIRKRGGSGYWLKVSEEKEIKDSGWDLGAEIHVKCFNGMVFLVGPGPQCHFHHAPILLTLLRTIQNQKHTKYRNKKSETYKIYEVFSFASTIQSLKILILLYNLSIYLN